jgi:hypothetical protein
VEAQAALNRPAFVNELAAEWIPQIPDVRALLADSGRATRLADVGCGLGWAAIELARVYPIFASMGTTQMRSRSPGRAETLPTQVSQTGSPLMSSTHRARTARVGTT